MRGERASCYLLPWSGGGEGTQQSSGGSTTYGDMSICRVFLGDVLRHHEKQANKMISLSQALSYHSCYHKAAELSVVKLIKDRTESLSLSNQSINYSRASDITLRATMGQ